MGELAPTDLSNLEDRMAKDVAKSKAGKVLIEISENDQIMNLIGEHTYQTSKFKKPETILKTLAMIASGTAKKVACRTTGLPYQTYVKWIHQPWYHQVMELIKIEFDNALDASLTATTHKTIDYLNDRMDNGDITGYDKEGNPIIKPMSGRDLGVTFATIFDRRQLLRNKPTSVSENKSVKEHLDIIQARFTECAIEDAEFEEITDEQK